MPTVVTVGSALLDRIYPVTNLPEPDGGAFARDEQLAVGGVAANVAAGLSTLGRETGVVSRVGRDDDGDRVLADLRERGIDALRVKRGEERSSYTMILRDDDGERMIIAGGESIPKLRLDENDIDYCREADAVFTSAYAPDPAVSALVEAAQEDGGFPPIVFDLAGPLAELEGRGTQKETIDDLLSVVDCFVSSEVPIESYLGCTGREAAAELRERGVSRAALTQGEDGALLLDGEEIVEVPAFGVDAVDTTGAGDAFSAGLVDSWVLDGKAAAKAGRFAAAVAAENCLGAGARGGLPTRETVESRLSLF
ncbi:carbohydrate kinase family protein [Haloarchaeobius sp. HME9146]|uniref:carbohydrate kinase family protein n=1 Tax=Haloarchaeobius sp. HME9146 TaxID=2978732 RepID=UPI0021BE4908|nr:carbohydrate kinase family protein [Haloarchaeobius sp. HME9146]MCT9095214.1 carbohydrate kinase family protein [Haloarchaeobius sp. HME9146]